jgi:uncharacterized protein (DUF58 family)
MLAFMAVSGLLGWLNIRGLCVTVQVPDELYAGSETLVTLSIDNRKRFLPSFLVSAAISGKPATFIMVDRRKSQSAPLLIAFKERGHHTLHTARISSPFPVNFFVRYRTVPVTGSFLVFAAPLAFSGPFESAKPDPGQAKESSGKGYEGELAKISDYRGGESLKMIHWRLSAKHEELKVKELTATGDEPVLLEFEAIPGKSLEERLSYCTFLVNRLGKWGRPVGLKLGEIVIPPAATRPHRLRLLGELAVYGKD